MRLSGLAAALAAAFVIPAAVAQEPDIVVTGQRLQEAVHTFAETVSAPVAADNQLARWDDEICPSVAGLGQRQAQALIDRIAYRANQIGLDPGASGCQANVLIYYTPDSDTFTRQFVQHERSLFGYFHEENISTLGHDALEDFIATPRAVRAWHVTRRVESQGFQIPSQNARQDPGPGRAFRDVNRVPSHGSRLNQSIRQDFARVIVIIDGRRAQGHTLNAIADYVAMTALAQLDANADTSGRPTILNLFTDTTATAPTEMTDWDLAYLQGVYGMTREAASSREQVNEISTRMLNQINHAPEPATAPPPANM